MIKKIPSFKCHECGYAAIDDNDLTAHIFYHKPSEYKSKGYNLYTEPQENLKIYLKTHYIENLYNCLKCDSKFDKFTDLEKHSINEHEQKNSFACEECD